MFSTRVNSQKLNIQTNALRRDWSFLQKVDVDASKVQDRSGVFQREIAIDGTTIPVYVKVYTYRKHPFQRLWRRSISKNEARNLLFFSNIGIHTPKIIGWGTKRNLFGKIVEEFIITETVAETDMLSRFIENTCPDRSTPEYCERRDAIIQQLAKWTREMHRHNFYHQDLKWRNILGRLNHQKVELFWIDCPNGDFSSAGFLHKKKQLKDCATLDKLARHHCTKDERIGFVAAYLDKPVDAPEVIKLSKDISLYRQNRFDEEDDRQAIERNAKKANALQS